MQGSRLSAAIVLVLLLLLYVNSRWRGHGAPVQHRAPAATAEQPRVIRQLSVARRIAEARNSSSAESSSASTGSRSSSSSDQQRRGADDNPHAFAQPDCNPTPHAGFNGGSLSWGMSFKVASAEECCNACKAHAKTCVPGAGGKEFLRRTFEGKETIERCAATMNSNEHGTAKAQPCNIFTFCPTPVSKGGLCWSNDVWNHTYGECWLKNQPNPGRPEAGAYGAYPDGYRKKHRTAPEKVQWMSGSLTAGPITVDGPHWHW